MTSSQSTSKMLQESIFIFSLQSLFHQNNGDYVKLIPGSTVLITYSEYKINLFIVHETNFGILIGS